MTTRARKAAPGKAKAVKHPRLTLKTGTCFCCGCTDEFGCDAGCSWLDEARTMCSECERIARTWLAWFRVTKALSTALTVQP